MHREGDGGFVCACGCKQGCAQVRTIWRGVLYVCSPHACLDGLNLAWVSVTSQAHGSALSPSLTQPTLAPLLLPRLIPPGGDECHCVALPARVHAAGEGEVGYFVLDSEGWLGNVEDGGQEGLLGIKATTHAHPRWYGYLPLQHQAPTSRPWTSFRFVSVSKYTRYCNCHFTYITQCPRTSRRCESTPISRHGHSNAFLL